MRLSTKQVLLFETETCAQIDDKWKKDRSFSPDKMRMYEEMQAGVKRLILAEALKLTTSKSPEDRKEGNFVLNQYREQIDGTSSADRREEERDGGRKRQRKDRIGGEGRGNGKREGSEFGKTDKDSGRRGQGFSLAATAVLNCNGW